MRGLGSGELKHPRFTKEEAAASEGTEHERLWKFILSLESPEVYAGGGAGVDGGQGGEHSQGGCWLGPFRRMATRYGGNPQEVKASEHKHLDKGAGPGAGFSVSKFGKRKIVNRLVSFELPQA